ncbi:hypothetical protein QTP86_026771, partial [Hemibagrus guttatus]
QVVESKRESFRHHRLSGKGQQSVAGASPQSPTARDDRLVSCGLGSELAQNAPPVRDRRRPKALFLDDRDVSQLFVNPLKNASIFFFFFLQLTSLINQ